MSHYRGKGLLAQSQGKTSGFDNNASKSIVVINLLKLKVLVDIDKQSLYVPIGMENILSVVGND